MLKREKWLYLIASILLIWNLTYLIIINVFPLPQKITWSDIFILSNEKLSSIRLLLFSLLSLIFTFIGICVSLFLNYKKYHSQTNKYSLGLVIALTLTIFVPFLLTFNSQMALASYYENIKTSSYDKPNNMIWLNTLSIWIISSGFLITSVVTLLLYAMNYNSLFKYSFNKEKSLTDLKEFAFNTVTSKSELSATGYLPNNNYNKFTDSSYIPNLNSTINVGDVERTTNYLQDSPIEEKIDLHHYETTQIIENNNIDDISLIQSNPTKNMKSLAGFTQQIKNEYERDFILVQELHRINMAQSNARIAKLINIFYDRYEKGLDLDVDRVMLLIYRVAIEYEPLYGYLKDAVLYKLDSKFISDLDLARNWFKNYSSKLNNSYSTNRYAFKKNIDEGIKIMDSDIEKYLQDSRFRK